MHCSRGKGPAALPLISNPVPAVSRSSDTVVFPQPGSGLCCTGVSIIQALG